MSCNLNIGSLDITVDMFFLFFCKDIKKYLVICIFDIIFADNLGIMSIENKRERLAWLDWMKVFAILSIIWGHFFSDGHVYLYVFSVQVFCVISGFLYKKAPDWQACLNRCFWQLFIPTIIMSVIMHLEVYLRCMLQETTYNILWPSFFKYLLLGHHWCMGPCWYFYTLIIMRLIMQLLPEKKWIYLLLFVMLSAGAIYLHHIGFEVSNAIVNVLVCMPFFLIGVFLKPLKQVFSALHNYYVEAGMLMISALLVYLCGHFNGYVWMYLDQYGNNFALYILGGMAGTAMLYVVSLWLSRLPYRSMLLLLSKGSIVIIGMHIIIVRRLQELSDRMWLEDLLFSVLILLAFVPFIRFLELYFPLLLGQFRRN